MPRIVKKKKKKKKKTATTTNQAHRINIITRQIEWLTPIPDDKMKASQKATRYSQPSIYNKLSYSSHQTTKNGNNLIKIFQYPLDENCRTTNIIYQTKVKTSTNQNKRKKKQNKKKTKRKTNKQTIENNII